MKNIKFELTENSINWKGYTLYQIKALQTFMTKSGVEISAGELGGWVEKEENLSQEGSAWVWSNAKVYGTSKVYGDAEVYGNAIIYGDSKISGYAKVCDNAEIWGDVEIWGDSEISGCSKVFGDA